MKYSNFSRALAFVLVLVMVLSMAPATVFASDSAVYSQITAADELTTGKYVMVVSSGYAPTVFDNGWVLTEAVSPVDGAITAPAANLVWDITVSGDTVTLTDSNGVTIAPKGGNNNGIKSAAYDWKVEFVDGTFRFLGQGEDTVYLASNTSSQYENKFRGYKTATVDKYPDGYLSYFTLYKLGEDSVEPTEPVETEPVVTEPVVTEAPFAAGDKVVIYAPAYGKALSTTKTGNYNVGVDVTVTDGVMTGYTAAEVFTVIDNGDGSFSFAYEGQNLGMADSYASMNLGAVNDDWTLVDLGGGLYNVQNTVRGNYMEWYANYSNWSTYNSSSAATDGQFQLSFYIVTGDIPVVPEPTDPTEPEPTDPVEPAGETAAYMAEAPMDGDTVLIYNTANTAVLGSEASGKKLSGVIAAAENDAIALADGMAKLLVTVEEEQYIFSLDGKYLTSAPTGNGLSFSEELTDCGKWTLELQEDGKYILKNVGANYNGNYNQAMEYYNGFTTYGVKTTDIYKMDFYLVDRPSQGGKITAADQLVSGTYVMMVEDGYAMGKLDGTWISVVQPTIKNDQVTDAMGGIWTLTVNGSSVQITDANGVSIKPKGGNNNGIASGSYDWAWSFDEATQTFTFAGTGSDTVKLASNASEDPTYGGFHKFRGYKNTTISGKPSQYPCNFTLYAVVEEKVESKLPAEGEQVVIYNLDSQGVLGAENDTQSIENVGGYVEEGTFIAENGAVVFTVSKNGSYYRFYNETYGYLCSNGTGNNAFYSQEASEDADWTLLEGKSGGFNLESRTAKFNGQYSQYLEYFSECYKTYSMYNVTNYDIYEFFFYPLNTDFTTGEVVGGIVNDPQMIFDIEAPVKDQDWVVTFTVETVFGLAGDITAKVFADPTDDGSQTFEIENGCALTGPDVLGVYTLTVPTEVIDQCGAGIALEVTAQDTTGHQFGYTLGYSIVDEPSIVNVSPAANSQTLDAKRPLIVATIVNAGADPIVTMTVNGEVVDATYVAGMLYWQSATDMADGRTTVTVTVTRADGKVAEKTWSFTVGVAQYELYFGQLHSHTTFSDGSGTLASALSYIENLPESANVDFVAFTDHSNYFDKSGDVNPEGALYDMSLAGINSQNLWSSYKSAVADFNARQNKVVAIGGFEMTWSGGPGHMNTFATPGIVSRNNSTLNNKTADAGMKAYYALLSRSEGVDGISQFNHPGTTFGNFSDFNYWDAVIDSRVYLVEVGNGEGSVGSGGYFPSYEQYTMALDKGWHLAPTNNQDNHKGKWGNANDARDVILTDNFTEEGIYEAIRNYRVYATEDKNLEIGYTVNGLQLGSIIEETPEKLDFQVTLFDPDSSDSISKVEVIVNSGKVAYTWDDPAELKDGLLTATLSPDYSYYYLRVTQGDGDLAVTAPVWVGEILKLGISSVECGTSTPVTGEELTISTTLFNSELSEAVVKSLTYSVGSQVLAVDTTGYTIPASGNTTLTFNYTPDTARVMKITVTAVVELDGVEYTFSMDVELDIQDADKLVYIGIDASHYNEYVAGNYKDSMGNFSNLAAGYSVRAVNLNTSDELIAACSNEKFVGLILTAPSRRLAAAQTDPRSYSAEELAALKAFNANGGAVILAGWSDNYENYDVIQSNSSILHMAAAQNEVLAALGSSLRIADDATYDDVRSAADGVDKWRLYFSTYGENFLTEGVEFDAEHPYDRMYTEVFSHYGGASIYTVDGTLPATVSPVVYAHATTYSVDVDKDGLGGSDIPKYTYSDGTDRLMVMAMEQLEGQGLIIVSGAAFMSNFEVQATIEDSASEKNYANYRICENLVSFLNPVTVTDIAEVQAQENEGIKYTIEGIVTSNASGFDKDTAFFDCIYLQDETAGINAFPVAGNFKIGDKVRITGTTSSYQGERQIAVTAIELISEGHEVAATEITAAQLNDGSKLGSLVTLKGTVESFEYANDLIQTIMVKDADGNVGRVFIDGYITTGYDVENLSVGARITVTGLASYDNSFAGPAPRIRVRDRKDVVCEAHQHTEEVLPGVAPTFDAAGLTEGVKCAECGEILVAQEEIPMLDYNEGIIPIAALTATAGDWQTGYEATEGPAGLVLDDDFGTIWHTDWYGTSRTNHWIQFEIDGAYTVDGLRYKPRTIGNTNGTITEFDIQVSADGETFTSVASGKWAADRTWKVAEFEGVHVKYVRLVALDAVTDNDYVFASASEIRLTGVETVHTYEAVVTAPTCTEGGYTTYTCACGHSYVADETAALGHTATEAVVENEKAPTCTEAGSYDSVVYCSVCDAEISRETVVIPATGHSEEVIPGKAPTCTETGLTEGKKCSVCGETLVEQEVISATGHSFGDWTVTTAPTCTGKGVEERSCACGETETREVEALGHDFVNGECSRCDETLTSSFEDVEAGDYFFDPVEWALEEGITTGATASTFDPEGSCLRASVVTFLWRAAGSPEPTSKENPFTDVHETDFFYNAVLWAVEKGITKGMTEDTFGPYLECNRAQVVTFLWRYLGQPKADSANSFTDVVAGAWYEAPINWAVSTGVTNGMTEDTFGPTVVCSRADVVTFLYRALAE